MAFDTPYCIAGVCHAIVAAGHSAAIRYLSPDSPNFPRKRLTASEVADASEVGLWLMGVYEKLGDLAEMTAGEGQAHALEAVAVYEALGAPPNAAIAFAVDFDATSDETHDGVLPYFQAAHQVCGDAGYRVTVYGSDRVNQAVFEAGYCHYRWLAGAYGWGGSGVAKDDPRRFEIKQLPQAARVAGLAVDLDDLVGSPESIGFWRKA